MSDFLAVPVMGAATTGSGVQAEGICLSPANKPEVASRPISRLRKYKKHLQMYLLEGFQLYFNNLLYYWNVNRKLRLLLLYYLSAMALYKVKLIKNISSREAWVSVSADDLAQARIAATLKCTKTEFIPDYNSIQLIGEAEYELLSGVEFKK